MNLKNGWKISTVLMTAMALLMAMGAGVKAEKIAAPALTVESDGTLDLDTLLNLQAGCSACHLACGYACRAPGLYCGFVSDCDSGEEKCTCACTQCSGGLEIVQWVEPL